MKFSAHSLICRLLILNRDAARTGTAGDQRGPTRLNLYPQRNRLILIPGNVGTSAKERNAPRDINGERLPNISVLEERSGIQTFQASQLGLRHQWQREEHFRVFITAVRLRGGLQPGPIGHRGRPEWRFDSNNRRFDVALAESTSI